MTNGLGSLATTAKWLCKPPATPHPRHLQHPICSADALEICEPSVGRATKTDAKARIVARPTAAGTIVRHLKTSVGERSTSTLAFVPLYAFKTVESLCIFKDSGNFSWSSFETQLSVVHQKLPGQRNASSCSAWGVVHGFVQPGQKDILRPSLRKPMYLDTKHTN